MNRLAFFILILSCCGGHLSAFGQDTLPKFSTRFVGNNRVIIGWSNPFDSLTQISIQRSHDSLKNFKTILSVTDPNAKQNGFADTKAPNDHMYYRLFVVRKGGSYFFTAAQKPVFDTARSISGPVTETGDSTTREAVLIEEKKKVEAFVPSFYVYTNRDGYVYLNLPDANEKKYRIRFYEEDESFLFELKNIRESGLTLDKANFHHAGWFYFELYNDEKLVEKHRFYLAKEF